MDFLAELVKVIGMEFMDQPKPRIIKDQASFFNQNAGLEKPELSSLFFSKYVNKEQTLGFKWLGDCNKILDYGCGTGTTMDVFFKVNPNSEAQFVGIDLAENAIEKVKKRYPQFSFYTVKDNKIPQVDGGSCDGAYLMHVLHHSYEHEAIFKEIYRKLSQGGRFLINDLSSNNPIIISARSVFGFAPKALQSKFSDDLVVDGSIPDKYKVSIVQVLQQLQDIGFKIENVGYGHLFLFILGWTDRILPLSKFSLIRMFYSAIESFEQWLLKFKFFQKRAELFYVQCRK
jgi:ubiquinone/menaquinone biosynthesis C-methylase UbiE